jgi:hypothetical protein
VVFQSRLLLHHLQNCYLLYCHLNCYLHLRPSYRSRLHLQNCYLNRLLNRLRRYSTMMSWDYYLMTMNYHSTSWSYYRLDYRYSRFRSFHFLSYRFRLQNRFQSYYLGWMGCS